MKNQIPASASEGEEDDHLDAQSLASDHVHNETSEIPFSFKLQYKIRRRIAVPTVNFEI